MELWSAWPCSLEGIDCSIGVATGRALCGVVGSSQRCEYTLAGDVVVLSARLMQASTDSILVDHKTIEKCNKIRFEVRPIQGKDMGF